jgi:2-phospho-L-lactate guanylyltransferase
VGAADGGAGDRQSHIALVVAMLEDTLVAALAADAVRRVLVVTPDPLVALLATRCGAEVLREEPAGGLNACLEHGEWILRQHDPGIVVGALQADLPALQSAHLSSAVSSAAGRRAFCPDRHGWGTTLLLSGAGGHLQPRFGLGSARAHLETGALPLAGPWSSLACDVDSSADLHAAREIGLGVHTAAVLAATSPRAVAAGPSRR